MGTSGGSDKLRAAASLHVVSFCFAVKSQTGLLLALPPGLILNSSYLSFLCAMQVTGLQSYCVICPWLGEGTNPVL